MQYLQLAHLSQFPVESPLQVSLVPLGKYWHSNLD